MEKKFWDKSAKKYDLVIGRYSKAYQRIYEIIRLGIKDKSVLEIGTGTGKIALATASAASSYLATDFSSEMLNIARSKNNLSSLRFESADATNLPYGSERFDCVIISNCLHIMPSSDKVLSEIKRVLKKDGKLYAPNFCTKGELRYNIAVFFAKFWGFKVYHNWSSFTYKQYLLSKGFTLLDSESLKGSHLIEMAICEKQN